MKTKYKLLTLASVVAFSSCNDEVTFTPEYPLNITVDSVMTVNIDAAEKYQIIDGFGASGAWTLDFIGKYWSVSNKEGIAELLFSSEIKDGQPKGIGLSQWRFNVGGGSAEQGDASKIEDKTRRVECFLDENGSYNWNKCMGQQYFMQKAKEYGCDQFILFTGTPPVFQTKNGYAWSNEGEGANLKEDCYDDFADFLATVAKHFEDEGYNITMVSPVNEPEFNWTGGQEGSGWRNSEVARLAKELDAKLTEKGLTDTKMLLAEAAKWYFLYEKNVGESGNNRGNVIYEYFDSESPNYIGDLEHMPNIICGHSYWTDMTWNTLYDYRSKVHEAAKKYDLKVYQTEWSMMTEGYEDCPVYDESSYMDISLAMAKVMYHDLATANVSSWSYWTAASMEVYSQKNRFWLIRLIPEGGDYGDIEGNGTFASGKNLWVLGNYSLFVRPGYQRIGLTVPEQNNKFFGTAYLSPDNDKLVIVYTNCTESSIKIENKFSSLEKEVEDYEQYTTSAVKDLRKEPDYQKGIIPARSVSTFVYTLK